MQKQCGTCRQIKPLGNYFTAPEDSRAGMVGTSEHCIQCHSEAKVKYGYGWYGEKYKTPSETK